MRGFQHQQSSGRIVPLFAQSWNQEERKAVMNVVDNTDNQLGEGNRVREFQENFAKFVGAKYCHLLPNNRIALYVALIAARREQKAIRVSANYGIFTAMACRENGFDQIMIGDVSSRTGSMEGYIDETRFVLHANGRPGNADTWEDCSQAIGRHTRGLISTYSFESTDLLTCGGIGGAICCDDRDTHEVIAAVKNHGKDKPDSDDYHTHLGGNFQVAEINAAFGIAQLRRLGRRLERLEAMYTIYQELLGNKVVWLDGVPSWRVDCLVTHPMLLIEKQKKFGIEAKRFYLPTYRQPQFKEDADVFQKTEFLYNHGIYLPSSPDLADDDIHYVCEKLKACLH